MTKRPHPAISKVQEPKPAHCATVPVDRAVLDEIIRRVVEVARPDRIILFGSAARGEMGPDSVIGPALREGRELYAI